MDTSSHAANPAPGLDAAGDIRSLEAQIVFVLESVTLVLSVAYFAYEARCYRPELGFEEAANARSRDKEIESRFWIVSTLFPITQVLCAALGALSVAGALNSGRTMRNLLTAESSLWIQAAFFLQYTLCFQRGVKTLRYKFFLKSMALEMLYPLLGVYVFYKYLSMSILRVHGCKKDLLALLIILAVIGTSATAISGLASILFRNLNICTQYSAKDIDRFRRAGSKSLFSRMTFSWVTPSIKKSVFSRITLDDFPDLEYKYRSEYVSSEIDAGMIGSRSPISVIFRLLRKDLLVQIAFSILSCVLYISEPYLFNKTLVQVTNVRPSSASAISALAISTILLITRLAAAVVDAQMYFSGTQISAAVKLGISDLIYRKVMLLRDGSSSITKKAPAATRAPISATMTNILTTDLQQISAYSKYMVYLLAMPIRVVSAIWLLLKIIGPASIPGLLAIISCCLLSVAISVFIPKFQASYLRATDRRIAITNEVLSMIRGIKMTSKEQHFAEAVHRLRKRELTKLALRRAVNIVLRRLSLISNIMTPAIVMYVYVFVMKKDLTPPIAFTAITMLRSLSTPLEMFFEYLYSCASGLVNIRRMMRLMGADEIEFYLTDSRDGSADMQDAAAGSPFVGFSSNASLSWENPRTPSNSTCGDKMELAPLLSIGTPPRGSPAAPNNRFALRDLNISFPKGKFTIIAGPTGSGKSSLLSSMLGEMYLMSGSVHMPLRKKINRSKSSGINQRLRDLGAVDVAYFRQNSWLINSTIRNNIVFNSDWDPVRYNNVLKSCSLDYYLDQLPKGDETVVGDFGMKLSGGQRLCVALARAAYSNAAVVLLDDPLSALDPKLLKHTVEECLLKFLKNRTLIATVNMIESCCNYADYIVVMEDGRVKIQGSRDEVVGIVRSSDNEIKAALQDQCCLDIRSAEVSDLLNPKKSAPTAKLISDYSAHITDSTDSTPLLLKPLDPEHGYIAGPPNQENERPDETLTSHDIEDTSHGRIAYHTYKSYLNASGGFFYLTVFVAAYIVVHLVGVAQIFVLKFWASTRDTVAPGPYARFDDWQFFKIYAEIGLLLILLRILQSIFEFSLSLKASARIHSNIIDSLLNTNIIFFDTVSIGQIMNRLFQDLQNIDYVIMPIISSLVESVVSVLDSLIVIAYSIPVFLIGLLPVYHMYNCISRTYLYSSMELQRLEKATQSRLYSFFKQSLDGVREIRSFGAFKLFHCEAQKLLDVNFKAYYYVWVINRWLALRTDSMNALALFIVAIGISILYSLDILDHGSAGVALGYSAIFSDYAMWTIRHRVHLEVNLTSMERIEEYINLERESLEAITSIAVPKDWPNEGKIEVRDICATYSSDKEAPQLVLKDLNFTIKGGEKLAIMGQTGSGKSTFLRLLLKLMNPLSGTILIDSLDISQLAPEDLRSRITTITQYPLIFSGTVRKNVDPSNQISDEEIESALVKVGLIANRSSSTHPGNSAPILENEQSCAGPASDPQHVLAASNISLDYWIEENGANLSHGQKQLLCIASAIVHNSRIIVLDEVTSSTDTITSNYINDLILQIFVNSTIICISHRIKPALKYDKIILFHRGEIVEYGTPYELLTKEPSELSNDTVSRSKTGGLFKSTCIECGVLEEYLRIVEERR